MVSNDITTAATRSTKASKALDTMRARITKADEARTEAAHQTREPRSGRGVGCPGDPCRHASSRVSPRRRAGRTHAPPVGALESPGLSVFSSRPARRPRTVGSVTVRAGLDPAGAPRRPIPASRAAAGRVCHPEGRSRAEDGAAVDTPGLRRLSGLFGVMVEALSTDTDTVREAAPPEVRGG